MKVIFNADDFGLTQGVNQGIVKAHLDGVVKSTTLMVGMPAEQHAVQLAKQLPDLKIGLHLRFTAGRPLTGERNLTDEHGVFTAYRDFGSVETINLRRYTMKLSPRLNIF